MNEKEFNGYNFRDKKHRKEMRYLVVTRGDLDINNCYAFKSLRSLKSYLKSRRGERVFAVFEIKDKTMELLK